MAAATPCVLVLVMHNAYIKYLDHCPGLLHFIERILLSQGRVWLERFESSVVKVLHCQSSLHILLISVHLTTVSVETACKTSMIEKDRRVCAKTKETTANRAHKVDGEALSAA